MFSDGIEYSIRDLNCVVNYCWRPAKLWCDSQNCCLLQCTFLASVCLSRLHEIHP